MSIIKASNLGFNYFKYADDDTSPEAIRAIEDVDLKIEAGQFIAILGHNGSGKSTLAKHINALLQPTSGTMWIDGVDTSEEADLWKVRQKAGMVFQNPDNQIIGTVVEEDVGFGPENIGVKTEDIWKRVEDALRKVGMLGFREKSPNRLSGGQKQRVAIAGVVAMHPECIVLDEPTAMLDPNGRREVLEVVRKLNQKEGVTVVLITHYMEEVVFADRVYVMDAGRIVMQGTPYEVFSHVDELEAMHLTVPEVTELGHLLRKHGIAIPEGILTAEELEEALLKCCVPGKAPESGKATESKIQSEGPAETSVTPTSETQTPAATVASLDLTAPAARTPILELRNISYTYGEHTVYEVKALDEISLRIFPGEFIGMIGHTGSGKSTLVQLLNGLLLPTSGEVLYEGRDIRSDGFDLRALRTKVGLVFQYPEHQLFETDVITDVCFGPKNEGLTKEQAMERAKKALAHVDVPESLYKASPFELSGGQKRRVAIAGVLAMDPRILILDEPTAGLDPQGRDEILERIKYLQVKRGITILLVTHSMEDAARYADRLIAVNEGKIAFDGTPREVFRHYRALEKMGLAAPQVTYLLNGLKEKGLPVDTDAMTVEEAAEEILRALRAGKEAGDHA